MGSLATWGAVAGAAEGVQKNIEVSREKEKADLDEQRELRLKALEDKYASQRQQTGINAELNLQEIKGKQSAELQAGELKVKQAEGSAERKLKASEGALDRVSAEKVASVKAESSGTADFKSVTLKTTSIDPETGMMTEKEEPITFNSREGKYYKDQGGTLVPYDLRNNIKPVEQRLYDNPNTAKQYLETPYGKKHGLPKWYGLMYGDAL